MKHFGFTLIECLIYLAIFGVFMSGLVVVLGNLNYRLVERERDFITLRDQQFIFDKVEWLLNTTDAITVIDISTLELSPAYMAIEDLIVIEETTGSDRHVMVSYTIDNKTIPQHIYVPL